jgi:hypothetical protein
VLGFFENVTQIQTATAMGLSLVHVARVLARFEPARALNLVGGARHRQLA